MKVLGVLLLLVMVAAAISVTQHEGWLTAWSLFFIFLGIPLLIVTTVDLGNTLRNAPHPSRLTLVIGYLLAVPQALFALLTVAVGVAIIGWVLYNSFFRARPEYTGGFLTFGLGPVMVLFGFGWLKQTISRGHRGDDHKA